MSLSMSKGAVRAREYRKSEAYRKKVQTDEYKARHAEAMRIWRQTHTQKRRKNNYESKRRWIEKNRDRYLAYLKKYRLKENLLKAQDATYAEFCREYGRQRNRKWKDKSRIKQYRPCMCRRIPVYLPFGVNPIDRGSPYLINNRDSSDILSCKSFAYELAGERREKMRIDGRH